MAQTTAQVLRLLRRKIEEVDPATSDWTDEELLDALSDAVLNLAVRRVTSLSGYVIISDRLTTGYGITPDMEDAHALLAVTRAAVDILDTVYRGRLERGELGVSWVSGMEEESSIAADKSYRDAIDGLREELQELIGVHMAPVAGNRIQ